jgi:hypothetical protein
MGTAPSSPIEDAGSPHSGVREKHNPAIIGALPAPAWVLILSGLEAKLVGKYVYILFV